MRKSIVILVAFALLGSGYWIVSSLMAARSLDLTPPAPSARIELQPARSPTAPEPATNERAVDDDEDHETHELDADGDFHAEQPGELQPLVEPPALTDDDPDPVVGEVAALQEARAMVQTLLAETDDPAAREEAMALLELIDSRQQ